MKKCISVLITILIFGNFLFSTYSFSYSGPQNRLTNKEEITYLAVFIKFKDNQNSNHIDDEACVQNAEKIFNTEGTFTMDTVKGAIEVPSFKKYYEMQSYGKLSITTEIFPKKDGKVVSYQDDQPIGYYLRYNENNKIGYKNKDEQTQRKTELVNKAVKAISAQVGQAKIAADHIDANNDEEVDAISFFVEGEKNLPSSIAWGDLLWSSASQSDSITETILGKKVKKYNIIYVDDYTQAASVFSLNRGTYGTIIHEFGHTLGYMDLYRHSSESENKPVGFYDIMGKTIGSNPQNLLTYFTSEYNRETNWHKPLEVIDKTTTNITLVKPKFQDDNEKRAIKIQQYPGSKEYFIVEYHEKQNTYDTHCADMSGIIVYRVNDENKYGGNLNGGEHRRKRPYLYIQTK